MDNAARLNAEYPHLKYVIARHDRGNLKLFRMALEASDEKVLPVFTFQQLAWAFLRFSDLDPEWHVRQLYNDELVSLLLAPCTDVSWVLPNPLPKPLAAQDALLNLVDRGSFVSFLLGSR